MPKAITPARTGVVDTNPAVEQFTVHSPDAQMTGEHTGGGREQGSLADPPPVVLADEVAVLGAELADTDGFKDAGLRDGDGLQLTEELADDEVEGVCDGGHPVTEYTAHNSTLTSQYIANTEQEASSTARPTGPATCGDRFGKKALLAPSRIA